MLGDDILEEEFKMLVRAARNERFRFIIIQYNHFSLTDRVKDVLENAYPSRDINLLDLNKIPKNEFISSLFNFHKGFVLIHGFEKLFEEDFRSLAIGFNQRRDKFSDYPITLISFLPWGEKYLQTFQKKMPDIFSLANPIIQLDQNVKIEGNDELDIEEIGNEFKNRETALSEIKRIEKRLKTIESNPENINLVYSLIIQLGRANRFLANFKKAINMYNIFLETNKNIMSTKQLINIYNEIGINLSSLGNYEEALKYQEKIIELDSDEKIIDTGVVFNNIAQIYVSLKDYKKALEYQLKSLNLRLKYFGENDLQTAISYNNIGGIYRHLNDYKKALEYLEKGLKIRLNIFGDEPNIEIATSYNNLAIIYMFLEDMEKALKFINKSLKLRLEIYGNNHPSIATCYNNLGGIYRRIGDKEKAIENYSMAYSILLKVFGEDHPHSKITKRNLELLTKVN